MAIFIPHSLSQLGLVTQDSELASCKVTGITTDSRYVKSGDLFVARDGVAHRGLDFIQQAIDKGAAAALVSAESTTVAEREGFSIPVIAVEKLPYKIGGLASQMLGNPGQSLKLIGITGTNGKTSCAHFIAQSLALLKCKTAIVGTVGNGFPGELKPATHTTPDAISLQCLLADFLAEGAQAVVMEVSSHALDQGRVQGVDFDVVALTNLSRDHLDYHQTMTAYGDAKKRLFTEFTKAKVVINSDDEFGRSLLSEPAVTAKGVISYSRHDSTASIFVIESILNEQGIGLALQLPMGVAHFNAPVIGEFNIANLLLTAGVLSACGYDCKLIESTMNNVTAVPGRMEYLSHQGFASAVIDYAHTPDALEKALQAARHHCLGQLWVVFGCGGDRDTGKRAEMARIAEQLADRILVTSDNPRTENPSSIIDMICQGFRSETPFMREEDRALAIKQAIQNAAADDLVLIAGKGHEDYQDIAGVKHPFSDQQVVLQVYQEEKGK